MGQHKFNPVAQAAKEGKIPPYPSAGTLAALAMEEFARINAEEKYLRHHSVSVAEQ